MLPDQFIFLIGEERKNLYFHRKHWGTMPRLSWGQSPVINKSFI